LAQNIWICAQAVNDNPLGGFGATILLGFIIFFFFYSYLHVLEESAVLLHIGGHLSEIGRVLDGN
jgi:hypothetical protein